MGSGFKPDEGRFELSLVGSIPTHFRQNFRNKKSLLINKKIKYQQGLFFIAFFKMIRGNPHDQSNIIVEKAADGGTISSLNKLNVFKKLRHLL